MLGQKNIIIYFYMLFVQRFKLIKRCCLQNKHDNEGDKDVYVHKGEECYLKWTGNWVTYLDTMIQAEITASNSRLYRIPTRIRCLRINPVIHESTITSRGNEQNGNIHNIMVFPKYGLQFNNNVNLNSKYTTS